MTILSFIALALGMAAATADRVPRPSMTVFGVRRLAAAVKAVASDRTPRRRRCRREPARHARVHRSQRRLFPPLRGAAAARAPGA